MDNNRRKLILGSAAVPLVLTVRPAAATAKKSIACIADGKYDDKKPWEILKKDDDGYMRKWVAVCWLEVEEYDDAKKKNVWKLQTWNSQNKKKFICGTDQCYWLLDKDDPYHAQATKTSFKKGYGVKETKFEDKQALAYYSSDSYHETGYGWEPKGGKHYKKSCWSSIKPKGY
ncbi:MAG: hypothetical protein ACREF4_03240 [Gammaproteobacteria bacterium]